jgi:hypothetical protein
VSHLRELPNQWRVQAEQLAPYAPAAAEAFRRAATELEQELGSSAESVTLAEGAAIGGYTVDHLQRLVAAGKIKNVGRKHRPRIRRIDVPAKPGYLPKDSAPSHFSARRRIVAAVLTGEPTT